MVYVEFMKNFYLADSKQLLSFRLIFASITQIVWFQLSRHDLLYVEFMKSSYLADSNNLMAPTLISGSWAQKRLIATF